MKTLNFILLILLALPAWGQEHDRHEEHPPENAETHGEHGNGEHAEHQADEHGEEMAVTMSDHNLRALGGRFATASAGTIRQQAHLPGEIQLNREAVAHVVPRFPGKVNKVNVNIGDPVKAGQVLATMESSETLTGFELKSLINGIVINRHITLGEVLTNQDTAFTVADLSTLWADIDLYPEQVARVEKGQPVRIATAHGPEPVETRIDYVSPVVDETTRTGLARVFLDNENKRWKPGMFIEATVTLDQFQSELVVPRSAVIQLENQTVIFVDAGEHWEARPVKPGRKDDERVEILSGLKAGERYLAEGGFVLKAELEKHEFESGHNH